MSSTSLVSEGFNKSTAVCCLPPKIGKARRNDKKVAAETPTPVSTGLTSS